MIGIRKCRKSTFFELFIKYLKENNINEDQIIQINLEEADYNFENYKELYDYVIENVYLLSEKLATLLCGRYVEIKNVTIIF